MDTSVKTCTKCNETKELSAFQKGHYSCRFCQNLRRKEWYWNNKPRSQVRMKENYLAKREERLAYVKAYRAAHKEQRNANDRARRKVDPQFRLAANLRKRISAFVRASKPGSSVKDLGCSLTELKLHLESQWSEGMSWSNYGEWEIDHIKPLSKFDLTKREEFLEACHYSNLQPLWESENNAKSNKWEKSA